MAIDQISINNLSKVYDNGFEALKQAPDWYKYTLGLIVSASFGIRGATKFFGKK